MVGLRTHTGTYVTWYNGVMGKTEIEELIEQAESAKKRWRKPEPDYHVTTRSWQEILDNQGYDAQQVAYLASRPGWI